jgi:hypothetical protein
VSEETRGQARRTSRPPTPSGVLGRDALRLVAWGLALVGYFGPWVGRRAAALAWNAYDLFDLLRLLPEIEAGTIQVHLPALRLPLVGLAVLLPLIAGGAPFPWRITAGVLGAGLAAMTLPPYPHILGAWRTPGWRVPFWWGSGAMGLALALVWLAPRLGRARPWIGLACALPPALAAALTFRRLLPALRRLHAAPIGAGWGLWLCVGALAVLGLAFGVEGASPAPRRGSSSR